ncbi:hypothetical protein TVAG_388580 [Trichomonas vaginalis G3]|uniref:Chorein N-terminal domain-containing protein n=1 Tax=Trichomonas vaginalis (strain ATCC PRA-98 / G3) TaxID=412133 RepID=A2DYJ1_TRIV3|nr:regulation of parkin-mediated stimulation of mitophagy in response to mitochondrial depolarization [Trichomonas vaginalis G3]EAY14526.1 hypothetical protein TVAG_388580 [Trichomonas vaginalis G3]KAI5529301.1 regulation of parkin-mediated stimulation of mitophagy in response to mitochondrial depolarization [Trichomonas vaginalis G3]|eukprot:XP_001326749.1 hypothetical protein [Trichomonas vaginalis G3]
MIDAVASKIIKKYLNDYIEDVSKNQLDMKIWKGDANFQDLILKKTALTNNGIPLTVTKGLLSKIHVTFPWKNLARDPTIINISDVYILVTPDAETVIKNDLQAANEAFHIGTSEDEKKANEIASTLHNLINTVIDNLHVNITNIHIRLEYSLNGANICFGFIIPSIRVYSVDENGNEIKGKKKKGQNMKKNLDISKVSIYFDTTDLPIDLDKFTELMKEKMSENFHQFILQPFSIHANLTHDRSKHALFETIISTVFENLHLSFDLMQCHTIILINRAYANFQKQRKFAHIIKPSPDDKAMFFNYLAKCAIVKARPNEFNPKLALTVLKNRKQYLQFYKERHKKHKIIHLKKDLEHLEKKIGTEASNILRRYSESIMLREKSSHITNQIDINELKKLVDQSENVFQMESIQMDFLIPKFEVEINLFQGEPLYKFIIEGLNGNMQNNSKNGFLQTLTCTIINAYSFPDQKSGNYNLKDAINIFKTEKPSLEMSKNDKLLNVKVDINPCTSKLDIRSVKNLQYFTSVKNPSLRTQTTANIIDFGQQLQIIRSIRGMNFNLNVKSFDYTMPYIENDLEKFVTFSIENIQLQTRPLNVTEKFLVITISNELTINSFRVDNQSLIDKMTFYSNNQLTFAKDDFNVELNIGCGLKNSRLIINENCINSLNNALKYQSSVLAASNDQKQPEQNVTTTYNITRLTFMTNFSLKNFNVDLYEKEILRSSFEMNDIECNFTKTRDNQMTDITVTDMTAEQYNTNYLKLKNTIISMTKDKVLVQSSTPFIVFDHLWIKFVQKSFNKLMSISASPQEENKQQKQNEPENLSNKNENLTNKNGNLTNKNENLTKVEEEPWMLEIDMKKPVIELAADYDNIVLNMEKFYMVSGKEMTIKIDKISGTRRDKMFLNELDILIDQKISEKGYLMKLDIPFLEINLDTDKYHSIMNAIYWYLEVTYNPNIPPSETIWEYEVSIKKISLGGYLFYSKIFDSILEDVFVKTTSNYKQSITDVTIETFKGNYLTQNQPLFVDSQNLKITYEGYKEDAKCTIIGDVKQFNLTREGFNWLIGIPFPATDPPETPPPPYPIDLNIKLSGLEAILIDNGVEYFKANTHGVSMTGVYNNAVALDIDLPDLKTETSYMSDVTFLDTSLLKLHYENYAIDLVFDEMNLNTAIIPLKTLLDSFSQTFYWMNNPNSENIDQEDLGWTLGLSLLSKSIRTNLFNLKNEKTLDILIENLKFCIKCVQKHAAVSLDKIDVKLENNDVFVLNNFIAAVSFIENDIPPQIEDIFAEKHIYCMRGFDFSKNSSTMSVNNIYVKYRHQTAQAILECIPFSDSPNKPKQTLSSTASSETSSVVSSSPSKVISNYQPKAVLSINEISIVFVIFEPLANIKVTNVNAGFSTIWSATVGGLAISPGLTNNSMIVCPVDKEFFRFEMKGEDFAMSLIESEVNFNYSFWLGLLSFVMRSPLIMSAYQSETNESNEEEVKSEVKSAKPNLSLKFNAPHLRLKLPTKSKSGTRHWVNLEFNTLVKMSSDVFSVNVSQCKLYISIDKIVYPPIFENLSVKYENVTKSNGKISNRIELSDFLWQISAADIILFNNIRSEVQEVVSKLRFPLPTSAEKGNTSVSFIKFSSGNLQLIMCRDNRSSTKCIPMFKVVIPPINFKLSSSSEFNAVAININPYTTYFNETTGNYDQIIEPIDLNIIAALNENSVNFMLKCAETVNINLPLMAVLQYMKMWDDIKSGMDGAINCDDLPSFWLSNRLGDDVQYIIAQDESKDGMIMMLAQEQAIPIYNIDMNCRISVLFGKNSVYFSPSILNYPTLLNETVSAVKKPYKGGMMVELSTPSEVENCLGINLIVFVKNDKQFVQNTKLRPGERYQLVWTSQKKETSLIFVGEGSDASSGHYEIIFSPKIDKPISFKIFYKKTQIFVRRTARTDRATGRRIFAIEPCCYLTSYLPLPLQAIPFEGQIPLVLQQGTKTEDLFIDTSQRKAKLVISLDGDTFNTWTIYLRERNPQVFSLIDPLSRKTVNLAVRVDAPIENDDNMLQINIYSPSIIFSSVKKPITVETVGKKSQSVKVDDRLFGMVCPDSFESDKTVEATILMEETKRSEPINLLVTQNRSLFLKTEIPDIFRPLRIDISQKDECSVLTISEMIIVKNCLPFSIGLQPILEIPKSFTESEEENSKNLKMHGPGSVVLEGETKEIQHVTQSGCFMLSVFGFLTTPALCLIKKQRTVFRVSSDKKFFIIELEVFDDGCSFYCVFKKSKFPTPFVITNDLEVPISVYHIIPRHSFNVYPLSTSIFAFDEPFAYPCLKILVNGKLLNISLIEDTGFVELISSTQEQKYYVAIRMTSEGFRTVILSDKIWEEKEKFSMNISLTFAGFAISMIDEYMRELFLLSLNDVSGSFDSGAKGSCLKIKVNEMQLDDQHTFSETPNVLSGRMNGKTPFFQMEMVLPPNILMFTSFDYLRINIERIDANLDINFLADVYNNLSVLLEQISYKIEPKLPLQNTSSVSRSANVSWLEVSPIFIYTAFRTSSNRPCETKKFPYSSFIPSISGVFEIPGVLLGQVSDTLQNIIDKISGDFKTEVFKQFIKMLGFSGSILDGLGVSQRIAEYLGIKMVSELNSEEDESSKLSQNTSDVYENRVNVIGVFSKESLELISRRANYFRAMPSEIISVLMENKHIENLQVKRVGRGVFGVWNEPSDAEDKTAVVLKQRRLPRAFPLNKIEKYSTEASTMQNKLQLALKNESENRQERIRMLLNPHDETYVCITDSLLVVMNKNDPKKVMRTYISQGTFSILANNSVKIKTNKGTTINIPYQSEKEAEETCAFLNSQKLALQIFEFSLI